MNLYSHYKNKPYKVLGIAKHSESLEDLVVYETLYKNELGSLWVRPRAMFEESVVIDHRSVPRFKKLELEIREVTVLTDDDFELIENIGSRCLPNWVSNTAKARLLEKSKPLLLIGLVDSKPVGFKLGYKLKDQVFYSYLGGVLPDFRGVGIAKDLMERQHQICKDLGYKTISMKTTNDHRAMLLLSIRSGFRVMGIEKNPGSTDKIILEKQLI